MKHYDVIIVGTGGANIVLDAALKKGLSCAQIEKGKFGGTCLTRGCIPTKVMVTAADAVQEIKELPKIGVEVGPAKINWDIMSRRVWEKIDESKEIAAYYDSFDNCDVYKGAASFTEDKVLIVTFPDGSTSEPMTGDIIVLGTGAHSQIPPTEGLESVGYLTSETLFGHKYPKAPYKSLIVLGGGPIGTEFAHVFNAAGTNVTLLGRNVRLLPKEDADISEQIYKDLSSQGISVKRGTDLISVRIENNLKVIRYKIRETGEESEVAAEEILVATGVKPAVEELHLERTSVQTHRGNWIKTNEFLETSVPGVYALGDVNGEAQFRHKANYEADILAHNLFVATTPKDFRWARYDNIPAVTYTYPQVGHVGLSEEQAVAAGYNVGTGINYYSSTAKGFAMGFDSGMENDGFVKIVVDKDTNYILGIHVIGPQASILFQPFVNLMNAGETKLTPINEEIASPLTKELRNEGLTRYLDPKSVISVGETMAPHPALSEVIMWTQVYYEKRW